MAALRIGADEYNLDFVVYGNVSATGLALHFLDGGEVLHAMSENQARAVWLLLPEDKRAEPKAKRKAKAEPGEG